MSSRKKITALNSAVELHNEDVVHVVITSDISQDSAGSSKKTTIQKIKEFILTGISVVTNWGTIEGDITDQVDLQDALAEKSDVGHTHVASEITDFQDAVTANTTVQENADDIANHVSDSNNPHAVTKTQVGLGNVTNDAQVKRSEMGANSGVATLDAGGKLSSSQIPAIAITDVFVVNSQASMLALTAEIGDVAVRTDLNKTFILKTAGATVLANWQEMLTPTDLVISVNGRTGAITLSVSDIPTLQDTIDNHAQMIMALSS